MDKSKNADIRAGIKASGLRQWEIAEWLGIRENAFSVMLRKELDEHMKAAIRLAILNLKKD